VLSGVPQGSVLGLLIFINDLLQQVLFSLLADNTKCYKTIADIMDSSQLQGDLNLLNIWSIDTNLVFNVSKIFQMSFKAQFTTSYSSIISRTDTHKDLRYSSTITSVYHAWTCMVPRNVTGGCFWETFMFHVCLFTLHEHAIMQFIHTLYLSHAREARSSCGDPNFEE